MREIVSLWKAPTKKLARKLETAGFKPKFYQGTPGQFPDGKAYFAKTIEFAQTYASCFGKGVIEVQLYQSDYVAFFQQFEQRCSGTSEIEIAIPRDFLGQFNKMTIRRIWHHG